MTDRLTMLLAAQFADHAPVETGPTVVTSSGLHAAIDAARAEEER